MFNLYQANEFVGHVCMARMQIDTEQYLGKRYIVSHVCSDKHKEEIEHLLNSFGFSVIGWGEKRVFFDTIRPLTTIVPLSVVSLVLRVPYENSVSEYKIGTPKEYLETLHKHKNIGHIGSLRSFQLMKKENLDKYLTYNTWREMYNGVCTLKHHQFSKYFEVKGEK